MDAQAKQQKKQIHSHGKNPSESSALDELGARHKAAVQRIAQIRNEIKALEQEHKGLETESYVKARRLSESYSNRDAEIIKEYGQRLKFIQKRLRDIETIIRELKEERDRISK